AVAHVAQDREAREPPGEGADRAGGAHVGAVDQVDAPAPQLARERQRRAQERPGVAGDRVVERPGGGLEPRPAEAVVGGRSRVDEQGDHIETRRRHRPGDAQRRLLGAADALPRQDVPDPHQAGSGAPARRRHAVVSPRRKTASKPAAPSARSRARVAGRPTRAGWVSTIRQAMRRRSTSSSWRASATSAPSTSHSSVAVAKPASSSTASSVTAGTATARPRPPARLLLRKSSVWNVAVGAP